MEIKHAISEPEDDPIPTASATPSPPETTCPYPYDINRETAPRKPSRSQAKRQKQEAKPKNNNHHRRNSGRSAKSSTPTAPTTPDLGAIQTAAFRCQTCNSIIEFQFPANLPFSILMRGIRHQHRSLQPACEADCVVYQFDVVVNMDKGDGEKDDKGKISLVTASGEPVNKPGQLALPGRDFNAGAVDVQKVRI